MASGANRRPAGETGAKRVKMRNRRVIAATRLTVGCWPTQARENVLGAFVGHPHHFADAERPRGRRHEGMPGHESLAKRRRDRNACQAMVAVATWDGRFPPGQ